MYRLTNGIVGVSVAASLWVGCVAVLVATRLAVAPRYLYHFDAANFALAMEEFNPALHQPQPPGYPLFVGLLRILHWFLPDAQHVLLAAGLLASIGSLVLLKHLGDRMFSAPAGWLAVAVFLVNPVFWFGGVSNQVRTFLAMCALTVASFAWQALTSGVPRRWLWASFAALGLAAGFRPALGATLAILLVWVWWRRDRSLRTLAGCGLALALTALPWIWWTVEAAGGLTIWLSLLRGYAQDQFGGSSLAFGAAPQGAWRMLQQALVWNFLGALTWLWALLFLPLRGLPRLPLAFLAVWFLPLFLFSAIIHIGDPDQALGSVPAVCLAGGAVLARLPKPAIVAAAVIGLNVLLFFLPPGRLARAASYRAITAVDRQTRRTLQSVEALRPTSGPFCVVYDHGAVTWRQLSYYYPDAFLLVLPDEPTRAPFLLHHRKRQPNVTLPACEKVLLTSANSVRLEPGSLFSRLVR